MSEAQCYFVTGTDTGVGKTVIATALSIGLEATYWKPVQTGVATEAADSEFVATWHGKENVFPESYRYAEPLAPLLAARGVGEEISLPKILSDFESLKYKSKRNLIVEGAGGALVPLANGILLCDLMRALRLPVIVVASTRLGTINHTLLTIEALQRRDLAVEGVIFSGAPAPATVNCVRESSGVKILGEVSLTPKFSRTWFLETFAGLDLGKTVMREQICMST